MNNQELIDEQYNEDQSGWRAKEVHWKLRVAAAVLFVLNLLLNYFEDGSVTPTLSVSIGLMFIVQLVGVSVLSAIVSAIVQAIGLAKKSLFSTMEMLFWLAAPILLLALLLFQIYGNYIM